MTDGVDGLATDAHATGGDDLAAIVKDQADGDTTFKVMATGVWARDQDLEGAVEAQRSKVHLFCIGYDFLADVQPRLQD